MFDETGGSGNEEIRLVRQGLGRRSVERVCVGHHRQICQLAVNGFPILELNYAICLLGLVLPLFERFKLHNAQGVPTISFFLFFQRRGSFRACFYCRGDHKNEDHH